MKIGKCPSSQPGKIPSHLPPSLARRTLGNGIPPVRRTVFQSQLRLAKHPFEIPILTAAVKPPKLLLSSERGVPLLGARLDSVAGVRLDSKTCSAFRGPGGRNLFLVDGRRRKK